VTDRPQEEEVVSKTMELRSKARERGGVARTGRWGGLPVGQDLHFWSV